jgi:hypothetical protein
MFGHQKPSARLLKIYYGTTEIYSRSTYISLTQTSKQECFLGVELNSVATTLIFSQRGLLFYDKKTYSVANRPKVLPHNNRGWIAGWIFPEMGTNFETVLVPLLFPYEFIEKLDHSQILRLKGLKTIGPSWIKPEKSLYFYERAEFFHAA